MKTLFFALIVCISVATGNAQSFYKVKATTETKIILGHKCIKYVRKEPEQTLTFWVANDLKDVDCQILYEAHPYTPCDQINGIPLMFELAMKNNGSYTATILEIRRKKCLHRSSSSINHTG
jgi:hypothetical protein